MPCSAPRPEPTIRAVGVARPRAHGQAMTSTAIPAKMARDKIFWDGFTQGTKEDERCIMDMKREGNVSQRITVARAITRTEGTKNAVTLSANSWIGDLGALTLLHQLDDIREERVFPDFIGLDLQKSHLINCSAYDHIPNLFPYRHRLTGSHGFVNLALSFGNYSVSRYLFPRLDNHYISNLELFDRYLLLFPVNNDAG